MNIMTVDIYYAAAAVQLTDYVCIPNFVKKCFSHFRVFMIILFFPLH